MYPGVGGALLLSLFFAGVCGVCKGEGGEIEGLVPIILQARPTRWVCLRTGTSYSARDSLICYPNTGSHYRSGHP